jgi:magnesium-transporting ATPase (P-type)
MKHLRVLARAQPAHKLRILKGLQKMESKVAVTGGSIADVDAIHNADVGLAMGSGCSAAKGVSDMILTNDDFNATLRAVMWGRNIYHNVSRFLQFQITVNISAVLVVCFGSFYFGESPLSAVQLLWINVIMDTMAAFALGTEPPLQAVVAGEPYRDMQVLQPQIWRQILGISLWNFLVVMCVVFLAPAVAGLTPYTYETPNTDEAKKAHMTYVFTIFVFLQLFNQINCRKDGVKEYNVFAKFFHNFYFVIVLLGEVAFQFFCTNVTPGLMGVSALGKKEWGACLMLGSTALLMSALLKCTPKRWVEKFKVGLVDETRVVEETGMLKAFNQAAATQVGGGAGPADDSKDAGAAEDLATKKLAA